MTWSCLGLGWCLVTSLLLLVCFERVCTACAAEVTDSDEISRQAKRANTVRQRILDELRQQVLIVPESTIDCLKQNDTSPTSTTHPLYVFIKQIFTERLSEASWQQMLNILHISPCFLLSGSYFKYHAYKLREILDFSPKLSTAEWHINMDLWRGLIAVNSGDGRSLKVIRQDRDAEGVEERGGERGVPIPIWLWCLGTIVRSPSGVHCGALAKNSFWCI